MVSNIKIWTELKNLLTGLQSQFWLCPCRTRADAECFLQISLSNKLLRPGISLNSAIILWTWKRREGRIHSLQPHIQIQHRKHIILWKQRKEILCQTTWVCSTTDIQHGVLPGGHRQNTYFGKKLGFELITVWTLGDHLQPTENMFIHNFCVTKLSCIHSAASHPLSILCLSRSRSWSWSCPLKTTESMDTIFVHTTYRAVGSFPYHHTAVQTLWCPTPSASETNYSYSCKPITMVWRAVK